MTLIFAIILGIAVITSTSLLIVLIYHLRNHQKREDLKPRYKGFSETFSS